MIKLLQRMAVLGLLAALGLGLSLGVAITSHAASYQFEEGTHYVALDIPLKTADPNTIEVTEYFSYGCPHCFRFEPLLHKWTASLPDDVVFNRTPAVWNSSYQFFAQIYYTLVAMDALEAGHTAVFRALHVDRRTIQDPRTMALYLAAYGVDPETFANTFNSFGVVSEVRKADARGRGYKATGVPVVIVNGKYRIESKAAGSADAMLEVADFLIDQERALIEGGTSQ